MTKVETRIIVERKKNGVTDLKIYPVTSDNPEGFHGVAEITVRSGQAVCCAVPRETLAEEAENER